MKSILSLALLIAGLFCYLKDTGKIETKSLVLLLMTVLCSIGLKAQNFVVTLTNNTTESFPLSDIQSVKFGTSTMILYELNGTVNTWDIEDIENYAFETATGVADQLNNANSHLYIYPNPATNLVNIQFFTSHSTHVTIDIIDANGKQVQQVFKGYHHGDKAYQWNNSVPRGIYYCRIGTANKVITKSIIIN